ncbi:MAG: PaaI family thioesterase [Verrucomicrobiota bacterium]
MDTTTVHTVTDQRASALREELHSHCFACSPDNDHGLNLVFGVDAEDVTRAIWHPSSAFQSYDGRIHGGILATLIDASMVHVLFARGIAGVTAEMTVRYLIPVLLGAPVEVATRLEAQTHGLYRLRAEVRQDGNLAARASAKFMALPETNGNQVHGRQHSQS